MSFHTRTRTLLVLVALFSFVNTSAAQAPEGCPCGADAMDTLVSAQWLNDHLDDANLLVLDATVMVERTPEGGMRIVNGKAHYDAGHIPGAGFADLLGELSDMDSPIKYALPTPERFAAAMAELGVGDNSHVILYDAEGSGWAARVWWMLRWIGFDRAALLDGGFKAWEVEGFPVSAEPVTRSPGQLTVALRPEVMVDRDQVMAAIGNESISLIDAMPAAHYRGEMEFYGRGGHIPGAENVPSFSLLDDLGRYRSEEELAALFGAERYRRAITYCGGGIAASSVAFTMTRLGFTNVAVYTASLQEWAADPANPMETVPSDH